MKDCQRVSVKIKLLHAVFYTKSLLLVPCVSHIEYYHLHPEFCQDENCIKICRDYVTICVLITFCLESLDCSSLVWFPARNIIEALSAREIL